jgi:hypothetical protein
MKALLLLMLLSAPAAATEPTPEPAPRQAAEIVAVHGEMLILEPGDEPGLGAGSILSVYRRLPSSRGTAEYRQAAIWWDVGRIRVLRVGPDGAVATWHGPPPSPVPVGLDESGAAPDRMHVGDRARATGAVGERARDVRVTFAREDLFATHDEHLNATGTKHLGTWLEGLKSMDGPIRVEVHARLPELGHEAPDLDRLISAENDAPFGPAPGTPTVPADRLYESPAISVSPPPAGRELVVVESTSKGPERWHYLDPITLAEQHGQDVASALAARLGLEPALVSVTVVPRGTWPEGEQVVGYDHPGDQVRILASGMSWAKPVPKRAPKPVEEVEDNKPQDRPPKRRLLEKVPEEISAGPPRARVPRGS